MERVRCVKCGSIGYTASPEAIRCSICGSREEVVEMEEGDRRLSKPVTAYLRRLLSLRNPREERGDKMHIVLYGGVR